jgi:hypothetical protein
MKKISDSYKFYIDEKKNWNGGRMLDELDPVLRAVNLFFSKIKTPLSLIDLGCGDGAFLRTINHPEITRKIGIDFNWKNENILGVEFISGEILAEIESIEVHQDMLFTCFDFLEHLSSEDISALFISINRRFCSEGRKIYFLIRSPNTVSPFSLYGQEGDITHISRLSIPKILQILINSEICVRKLFCKGSNYINWFKLKLLPFSIFSSLSLFIWRMAMRGFGCRDEADFQPAFILSFEMLPRRL